MTIFTRLLDREVLDTEELAEVLVMSIPGLFDLKYNREFASGNLGESISLSASVAQKTFTINILANDISGRSQMILRRYLSESGWYKMVDEDLCPDGVEFTVVTIDAAFFDSGSGLTITCQSRYGDLVDEVAEVLFEKVLEVQEEFSPRRVVYTNTNDVAAEIALTLSTEKQSVWHAGTKIQILTNDSDSITALIGRTLSDGNLGDYRGHDFVLNSDREVTSGKGLILPLESTFFTIEPGVTVTIQISGFSDPTADQTNVTVRLEAKTVQRKEVTR